MANPTLPFSTNSKATNENNPQKRKYEYPPPNYIPPKGTLRVHSNEIRSARSAGRILQQWTLCTKPRSEPRKGCLMGYFGYFVREENGVIRKAIWAGKGDCDWVEDEVVEDEEVEDEKVEDGEVQDGEKRV